MTKTSEIISFITLVAAQAYVWCLFYEGVESRGYLQFALSIVTAYGIVGALRAVTNGPESGQGCVTVHFVRWLMPTIALSLLVSEIWSKYDVLNNKEAAFYFPLFAGFIAGLFMIVCMDIVVDLFLVACLGFVCAIGIIQQNAMVVLASVMYGIQHFALIKNDISVFQIPTYDLYNYLLAAFTITAFLGVIKS